MDPCKFQRLLRRISRGGVWPQRRLALAMLASLPFLALGCGSVETRSSKAAGVNLSQYRTFGFADSTEPSDQRFFTPTNEARVRNAIQSELERHGLRLTEPAELELCVYLKTTARTYDRMNPSVGHGSVKSDLRTHYGLLYDNSWGTQSTITYPEGTLVVQAVDVKENRKVWEGIATAALHQDAPTERLEARIREAVAGMFRDFPRH